MSETIGGTVTVHSLYFCGGDSMYAHGSVAFDMTTAGRGGGGGGAVKFFTLMAKKPLHAPA